MARKRTILSDDDYSQESSEEYELGSSKTPAARARATNSRAKRQVPRKTANTKPKRVKLDIEDSEAEGSVSSGPGTLHAASIHVVTDPEPIRAALLEWYGKVHESRGMPWRKPYNPDLSVEERAQRAYEVWISEIMLQQTQVNTVIPYYNRWMARFPTIRDLAASDIETVNSLWKGLGYYSRAARLLSGAKKAVEHFDGRLPDNARDMETHIPGIGRYSAGAICSIAYNQCVPVLDGNVHRLLSRLLAVHASPKGKQTLDVLWSGAAALVDGCTRPGDLNQGLIELGATVCKVRDPQCGSCPVREWCHAYRLERTSSAKVPPTTEGAARGGRGEVGDIEELCALCEPLPAGRAVTSFPMKASKKKAREELDMVNVIEWRRQAGGERWFLLVRRPEGGLLAGLHEFPTAPNVPETTPRAERIEMVHTLLSALLAVPLAQPARTSADPPGMAASSAEGSSTVRIVQMAPAGDVVHIFSHIRKTYRVQWVVLEGGGPAPPCLASPAHCQAARPGGGGGGPAKRTSAVAGRKAANARNAPSTAGHPPPRAMWLPLDDVTDANIGTGVLKVWNQARRLWGDVS